MSKKHEDFFKEKKIWSKVKDALLACYLKPYIQKILATRRPLYYIDCFAGKGRFDDGDAGSPIIALNIIIKCLKESRMKSPKIESYFIELRHADALSKNIAGYPNAESIHGEYENLIENLLQSKKEANIFLYIDPYGIKSLNIELFKKLPNYGFNSIELLINLNSFGFIREACRVLEVSYSDVEDFDDIVEYEPSLMEPSLQSKQLLTSIAGGDYWEKIISDKKAGKINGYQAEEEFVRQYCSQLEKIYKYVLNMPIRLKKGHRPKYRMIHATNHEEGCLIMCENMFKRAEMWREVQSRGQLSLLDISSDGRHISPQELRQKLEQHLQSYPTPEISNNILASFFTKNGILCTKAKLTDILKKLEKIGLIEVTRERPTTPTGKPATTLISKSDNKIYIRYKP